MSIKKTTASGFDALMLATTLLQRVRQVDPLAGLLEAADIQWWWRSPRPSDAVDKLFWIDDQGPVAGVLITSWSDGLWQFDPVVVPGAFGPAPEEVWSSMLKRIAMYAPGQFGVPVRDDDRVFQELARRTGLVAKGHDHTGWMDAAEAPPLSPLPNGFLITDRGQRQHLPHPMRHRTGEAVAGRLAQCALYDAEMDLAIETSDGVTAAYSLYWFDPVTRVGLVEPMRVEDTFQRRGLARAMLTVGIDRLVRRGATRVKVSWESDAAGRLYQGIGFQRESSAIWYRELTPERN